MAKRHFPAHHDHLDQVSSPARAPVVNGRQPAPQERSRAKGSTATAEVVRRLIVNARYEVLPTPSTEERVVANVPLDRVLTVTASPTKGITATLELTESLAGHGYVVVPHLAARMISGRVELAEIVQRLTQRGIDHVFVPAGDADPVGDYREALELLRDLTELGSPFEHVGITGYPEPHPTIHDDVTVQSMWDKRLHATHIVSNLTFSPAVIGTWITRLHARGITAPVLLGVPGPVERSKLLAMATKIGVGESTRFLAKNKGLFARIAAPGGFTSERFLVGCAQAVGGSSGALEGLHLFTFNQVAEAEVWRTSLLNRLGDPGQLASDQ